MQVRPLSWRDLPALYRSRRHSVFLNTALLLTRGPLQIQGALLSYLAPSMGVFTSSSSGGDGGAKRMFGQTIHRSGSQFSHLTFITPETGLESALFSSTIEYLIRNSGKHGAMRMLADVDEGHMIFEVLRSSSFATYTRQRIWQFQFKRSPRSETSTTWHTAGSQDGMAVRTLYHNLVPGMVQQVEPFSMNKLDTPHGMLCRLEGELLAYVELRYGHRGIWMQPFVHPDTPDVADKLNDLVWNLPNRRSRPVYICVRTYQSWMESSLEDIGAQPGPSQALMAKHLTVPNKSVVFQELPAIEGSQPEITASSVVEEV